MHQAITLFPADTQLQQLHRRYCQLQDRNAFQLNRLSKSQQSQQALSESVAELAAAAAQSKPVDDKGATTTPSPQLPATTAGADGQGTAASASSRGVAGSSGRSSKTPPSSPSPSSDSSGSGGSRRGGGGGGDSSRSSSAAANIQATKQNLASLQQELRRAKELLRRARLRAAELEAREQQMRRQFQPWRTTAGPPLQSAAATAAAVANSSGIKASPFQTRNFFQHQTGAPPPPTVPPLPWRSSSGITLTPDRIRHLCTILGMTRPTHELIVAATGVNPSVTSSLGSSSISAPVAAAAAAAQHQPHSQSEAAAAAAVATSVDHSSMVRQAALRQVRLAYIAQAARLHPDKLQLLQSQRAAAAVESSSTGGADGGSASTAPAGAAAAARADTTAAAASASLSGVGGGGGGHEAFLLLHAAYEELKRHLAPQ